MAFSNDKPDTLCKQISGKSRLRLSKMFMPFGYIYEDTIILKENEILFVNISNFYGGLQNQNFSLNFCSVYIASYWYLLFFEMLAFIKDSEGSQDISEMQEQGKDYSSKTLRFVSLNFGPLMVSLERGYLLIGMSSLTRLIATIKVTVFKWRAQGLCRSCLVLCEQEIISIPHCLWNIKLDHSLILLITTLGCTTILLSDSISGDEQQQTLWETGVLSPRSCFSLCPTGLIPTKT